jgi:Flp pilus assembly protein TadG
LYSAVAGGVLALAHALRRRRLTTTLSRTARLVAAPAEAKKQIDGAAAHSRFAYGPAIAIGAIVRGAPGEVRVRIMKRIKSERGAALLEAAITLPMLLLVAVGIFEFGRAYQTWQILTNAAREGARMAVLADPSNSNIENRVRDYMAAGQLSEYAAAGVDINRSASFTVNGNPVSASQVSIDYPFSFIVLQPVARLVAPTTSLGGAVVMHAQALMRNETQ